MRTTLNIDEDVLEAAKSMAYIHQVSLGEAVSMLARVAMRGPVGTRRDPETGWWVFDVPEDSPKFGLEEIQRAADLEDLEYAKYFRKP